MEKIDILLATYNGSKYLREQLDSILSQTYTNFSLIISDDSSRDDTRKILEEYKNKDNRIQVFYQKENLGYLKNFEFLCSKIESNYCMFSDQDDVWKKDKIEKMYNYMIKKNSNLVYCDLEVVDENLKTIYPSMIRFMNKYTICNRYNDFRLFKLDNVVTGCALLTRKEVIERSLPFPGSVYVHDWWVATIASQFGSVDFLDEALVLYRQHGNNSIGINSQIFKDKNFKEYRNSILNFHSKQFEICKNNYIKFNNDNKKYIDYGYYYFNVKKKINYFLKIYKDEKITRKIKLLIMFHFPFIGKLMYNLRRTTRRFLK